MAIATVGSDGIPDITVDWMTGGEPNIIKAIEVKFNDSGRPPQELTSEIPKYKAFAGNNWLVEVSNLSKATETYLKNKGGVRFDDSLYP